MLNRLIDWSARNTFIVIRIFFYITIVFRLIFIIMLFPGIVISFIRLLIYFIGNKVNAECIFSGKINSGAVCKAVNYYKPSACFNIFLYLFVGSCFTIQCHPFSVDG